MASAKRAWKVGTSCLKPGVSTFARLLAMTSSRWACAAAPSAEMYIPYGMEREESQVAPLRRLPSKQGPCRTSCCQRADHRNAEIQSENGRTYRYSQTPASMIDETQSAKSADKNAHVRQVRRIRCFLCFQTHPYPSRRKSRSVSPT